MDKMRSKTGASLYVLSSLLITIMPRQIFWRWSSIAHQKTIRKTIIFPEKSKSIETLSSLAVNNLTQNA